MKLVAVASALVALLASCPALSSPPRPDLLDRLIREEGIDRAREVLEADRMPASAIGPSLASSRTHSGRVRALLLLVDFSDLAADTIIHNRPWFDRMLFDSTNASGMRGYYLANSYGRLDIAGEVRGWFRVSSPIAYYADGRRGMGYYPRNSQRLIEDAVSAADPYVDFSAFDNDGPDGLPSSGDDDGVVDFLLVVHAGQGYEWTMNPGDIHSHAGSIRGAVADGVTVREYAIEPEEGRVGTFAHEMGHLLGLPDLYDVSLNSFGLGMWSLMAYGSWGGGDGSRPVGLDAWSKVRLGFITPRTVTANQAGLGLASVEDHPDVLRLWSEGEGGDQYFLVENRRAKSYDSYLAGLGQGLLVYHVDERYQDNSSEARHLVYLEQADGDYDLDQHRYFGFGSDAGDPFPGATGNRTFSWWTAPANHSNEGLPTEVSLRNIGDSGDTVTMDVEVTSPVIVFESSVVSDPAGDGDGELDPGEDVTLGVRLRNHGIGCGAVTVALATSDPFVTLLSATVNAGVVAGHSVSPYISFGLRASPAIPQPHNVTVRLSVTGYSEVGGYSSEEDFVVAVPLRRLAGWPREGGDAIFCPPAVADLDGDGVKEIILGDYTGLAYAWKENGSLLPGWPVALGGRTTSKPAVCDLDIDGSPEVVIASQDGRVHALRSDGTPLPGWPKATGGPIVASAALADIDDDGVVEVICGSKDGKVYAWNEDGSPVDGWPVDMEGYEVWMSAAVGDCDGDHVPEVVVGGYGGMLAAIRGDGTMLPGWPILFGWGCGAGSPSIADFDGDGDCEIAVSGLFSNSIYLVGYDGRVKPGWPRWAYNCSSLSSPIPADIDGDGLPEIAVSTSCGTMVAWKADGDRCEVIDAATSGVIEYCEPLFIDLDGNGTMECILGTSGGAPSRLHAFGREGAVVGFPIDVEGSIWATPTVADIEGDGYAEIVVATTSGKVYLWRFVGAKAAGRSEWSQSRGDVWNTALYGLVRRDNIPLADLSIVAAGIGFDPVKPRQGEDVAIRARVTNIGHAAAEGFALAALYDDAGEERPIASVVVPSLGAKRDTTVELHWTVPGGAATRLVTVRVDGADVVLERSELNNSGKQRFYLSVADLSTAVEEVAPFPAVIGETVTLRARLANAGADVARGFEVSFFDSLVAAPHRFAAISVDSLAPGEEIDLEADYLVEGFPGDFIALWCVADAAGQVLEYHLSNNAARFDLNSGVDGDLIVPSLPVPPRTFRCSRTALVMEPTVCSCVLVTAAEEPYEALFESDGSDADLCRNTVVYASGGDIAGFDVATRVPYLVSATAADESQPAVWGESIVWVAETDESAALVVKRGAGEPYTVRTAGPGAISSPDVSSRLAVWAERGASGWDIWGYDLAAGEVLPVCLDQGDQVEPSVWGSVVVWEDRASDGGDIAALDVESGEAWAVARGPGAQQNPDVSGDLVAWQDSRNGNWDIYAYSFSEGRGYPVSRQASSQVSPCITDSTIYWSDRRTGGGRVMGFRTGGHRAVAGVRRFEALSQDALIRVAIGVDELEDAVTYKIYRYSDYKWDPEEQKPKVREYFHLDGDSLHVFEDTLVVERRSYFYKLGVVDGYGEERIYGPVQGQSFRRSAREYALGAPYPNPFLHQVDVAFGLPRTSAQSDQASWPDPAVDLSGVEVKVYTVGGRLVRTLKTAALSPGYYRFTWDGRNDRGVPAGAGVYYITVASRGYFASRKVVLLQ